ncbi:sensor domain-containing diguanylate cyclase [uncultured Campylobacter sp.]|uniref:sensor domain-containing diguanylate cyclase n=1 Tax=uncultured Campylobacter sp. TaxID=218934 RepID=UPI0028EF95E5|nr:sensor domain-containing diguanylate cyclase [uncultured Campylobacter sp.]
MYSVKLHICLSEDLKNKLEILEKIQPRPRFTHEFSTIKSSSDIPTPIPDENQYLIIASENCGLNLSELKNRIGKNGFLAIYARDADKITGEQKQIADEIWLESANLDDFYFEKALNLIAERKESWLQKTWLQTLINSSPDMIWFKDMDGLHLEVNDAFCEVVDKQKDDVRGKDHYYIWNIPKEIYEQTGYVCVQTEDDVVAARKTCLLDEEVMKADGNLSKLKTYKTPIFDGETIIGTVGIARDVTKEYEYLQNIEHLAHYDQLTGLANRNQLDAFLDKLKTTHMSILYMDLDRFKQVNDEHGHQAGDKALVAIAELIKEIFSDAMNVRIGGDEFISIFTDGANMQSIAPRVQILINRFFKICQENPLFNGLSVSAGIAEGQIGHGSFDLLLQRADDALYRAKHAGRGTYCINPWEDFEQK